MNGRTTPSICGATRLTLWPHASPMPSPATSGAPHSRSGGRRTCRRTTVGTPSPEDGDITMKCPTELHPLIMQNELSKLGFIPLVYYKGTDGVGFTGTWNGNRKPAYHLKRRRECECESLCAPAVHLRGLAVRALLGKMMRLCRIFYVPGAMRIFSTSGLASTFCSTIWPRRTVEGEGASITRRKN